MAESGAQIRAANFWKLHFQKIGLELKCSLCLNTLNRPMLLPCDHIFCCTCISSSTESGSNCPICNLHYLDKELRHTPHMENILSIYKSMEVALGTVPFQSTKRADTDVDGPVIGDHSRGRDSNQMSQPSPHTPPSFGETKESDDEHSSKRLPVESIVTEEIDVVKAAKTCESPNTDGKVGHARETKRQKLEFGFQNGIHPQSKNLDDENSLRSKSETGLKLKKEVSGTKSPTPDNLDENSSFVCAFCQSSKVSEGYGPMLHYKKGKPVGMDKLTQHDVLHVHKSCTEWTPQVYYQGEIVHNLESELARAAKLKCNECKQKGAALGCLVKSCRKSFHVPCAVSNDGCRWDTENFVMLCPTHSSHKFRGEKSKPKTPTGNHQSTTKIPIQQTSLSTNALVICGSDLSSSEKDLLHKFAKITGANVSKLWDPNVTHVIAATDEKGAFCRTLKVLMGILHGRWIVNIDWVKACIEARKPVNEEPYEVNTDVHGCQDGPKKGRLRVLENAAMLFNGLRFCFSGNFQPNYKGYLKELVEAAGGTILTKDMLISLGCDEDEECSRSLVVYSLDTSPECDPIVRKQMQEEAEGLAFQARSWVVGHTWILESIASVKLQPFSR